MAGRPTGLVEPMPPTPRNDISDPLPAGPTGRALRASAHGISHLIVKRIGRRHSAVEHLINTSGVEPIGLVLRP